MIGRLTRISRCRKSECTLGPNRLEAALTSWRCRITSVMSKLSSSKVKLEKVRHWLVTCKDFS